MSVAVDYAPVLLTHPGRTTRVSLDEYQAEDGYAGWRKALTRMTPEQVVEEVKASGLRGRGGAGFPTGNKWGFIPKAPGAKYVAVNADESEPGTFKDRELMEVEPHRVLEGVALCGYAIGAETAFIYIRGEYTGPYEILVAALEELKGRKEVLGAVSFLVHRGAGAYICGEETALLESLEGRRPMPRSRPPFPAVEGLYRRPTVINNVETLANVPAIIDRGSGWYNGIGVPPRNTGPKIFCLSGRVNRPGNYELPLGAVTIRELIDGYGQGVIGGKAVKGVLTAGVSAPILTADKLDTKLDYDSVQAAGSMLGSASLIVLDEDTCIVRAATVMEEFFRHESCGKCTPCREGTSWLFKVMARIEQGRGVPADLDLLLSLSAEISGKVLCALGDFATSPIVATVKQYRDEYQRHIDEGACPFDPW